MSDPVNSIDNAAETGVNPSARRFPPWVRAVIVALAVLIVLYLLAAFIVKDKVPRGTTVVGVEIGGMNREAATEHLQTELEPLTTEPFAVTLNDTEGQIDPTEAGLTFDAAQTVDGLVGFSVSPARLWAQVVGGSEVQPVVEVDEPTLKRTISGMASAFTVLPVDGNVQFSDGEIETSASEEGSEVDIPSAATDVSRNWLTGERPLPFPSQTLLPEIDDAEVERAVKEDAEPLIASAIRVEVSDETATLSPDQLAEAAAFAPDGSRLNLEVDGKMLAEDIREELPDIENAPVDAKIKLVDGTPQITPARAGAQVDTEVLAADVIAASKTEERTTEAQFQEVEPSLTTEAAEALGVKEQVSSFSTYVTADPVRTDNLRNGAAKISNVLVLPGETFSLLEALGPITAENGFGNAGILVEGVLTEGMGGGLSQLATTVYNAVFFSGLEDVEHTPHSQYFTRYPEVREATIFVPSIDVKFRNDTDYGVLIQSWVADEQLHVAFWSTKVWDIEARHSGRSQVVQPTTVKSTYWNCRPSGLGTPGFVATVERLFHKDGELVKTESYTWRYEPQNAIECV